MSSPLRQTDQNAQKVAFLVTAGHNRGRSAWHGIAGGLKNCQDRKMLLRLLLMARPTNRDGRRLMRVSDFFLRRIGI